MNAQNETPTIAERYLTFKQATEFLKCGPTKLYGLAQSGKIPAIKFGSRWLFDSQELDKYLKKHNNTFRITNINSKTANNKITAERRIIR